MSAPRDTGQVRRGVISDRRGFALARCLASSHHGMREEFVRAKPGNVTKLSHLVLHIHHLEDGGAVVGDGDVVVRGHHHLVQPPRAQGRLEGVGDGLGGHDVALQGWGQ